MIILVTGAAGFIGFHLTKKLVEEGNVVIGLDNFNAYYDQSLKRARAKILQEMGITVVEGDICDEFLVADLFQKYSFTHVANMAAQAGVRYSLTNPKSYLGPNIEGFVTLLEACKDQKIPFVYASSSSVYGSNTKVPFSVKDPVDNPTNLYGATKKANELIAFAYHHLYAIPVTALRFFTVYGPYGRPDMAYFSFTKSLFEGISLPVFNEGKMERDFTYIDDIVNGIIAALKLSAPCEIFNLGNNQPQSLMTFIEHLEEATMKKANIHFLPMQKGDMLKTYADIEHSTEKLGFVPKTPLSKGIPLFVDWYRSYYPRNGSSTVGIK